jgi:two-component SAPR family response regulator
MSCHPLWQPNVLPPLFAKALELNIESSYVRHFIRARHLKAPSLDLKHWPWPVQIFVLGRFSILIDDQELSFKTKPPKKPLELLKCIIAHGNQGVSQNTLIYELWPDLDGDAGRNAFDLALHRLRKLFVSQDALEVQDGRLMINQTEVWVDAWSFDRLCKDLETEKRVTDGLSKDAQRLLGLYRGHFLEGDDHAWLLACRERLNSKFTRTIGSLSQKLMSVGAWDDATTLYRKAIEFDPLIEEFHRGLMQSYQAQGKISEALAAYRHCQDMLSIVLGIQPSQQTQSVYRSLKSS